MSSSDRPRFETTRWSLVLAAGGATSEANSALATLCETYWLPVYGYIRRTGRSTDDARDLTQAFFTRVIEKQGFKGANREQGRFRSFLLGSVRHFLINQHEWDSAQKRGGGRAHFPLQFERGEQQYQLEPVEHDTPERVYERQWAQTVLAQARALVGEKYAGSARQETFARLEPFLTGSEPNYTELAAALQVSEGAVRVAVHRLRKLFSDCLRAVITETVDQPAEVDEELRYLLEVVSR
jgi:RNA polymerase sigma-70 factor (ECF subfamily)